MKKDDFNLILEDLQKRRIPGEIKKTVQILLDKKAEKITVLKLKGISEMTDYLKIELKLQPLGSEGERLSEWILVDYVDFIINIFSADWRKKFSLEKLWMDAKRYDFYPDF
jgi:ribosomal silencing factor RsfS